MADTQANSNSTLEVQPTRDDFDRDELNAALAREGGVDLEEFLAEFERETERAAAEKAAAEAGGG